MDKLRIAIITILFLSGCASQYEVQFDSDLQGAVLVCNGKNWGYTPMSLYYPKKYLKGMSELNLSDCSANWVSGAKATYSSVSLNEFPDGVRITAKRPYAPNVEQDINFSLKVQQFKYQQAMDQAQANANGWENLNRALNNANDSMRRNIDSMNKSLEGRRPTKTNTTCLNALGGVVHCSSTSY